VQLSGLNLGIIFEVTVMKQKKQKTSTEQKQQLKKYLGKNSHKESDFLKV
jgi:hypothetical protein